MIKRFFKLLYILAIVGITLYIPIYIFYDISVNLGKDRIVEYTYKARCKSNNEYVILQGAHEPYEFNNLILNTADLDTKKDLNFYCKYYDDILPMIKNYDGSREGNLAFFNFKKAVFPSVSSYQELYNLETVKREIHYYYIYGAVIDTFVSALAIFILLQFIRICYVYIIFGKFVWHPFKRIKDN